MRVERHGGHARAERLAANDQSDRGAWRRAGALDIAHRNRRADAWSKAAGGDAADRSACVVDNVGAFARRRLAVRPQADPAAGRTAGELGADAIGAREAALLAPPLGDRPG